MVHITGNLQGNNGNLLLLFQYCSLINYHFQALGKEEIQLRIKEGFEVCQILQEKLSKYTCIRLLSQKPGGDLGSSTIQGLIDKPVSSPVRIIS